METINPNIVRSGVSGMLFGVIYMIIYITSLCLVEKLFGSEYRHLMKAIIVFIPMGIVVGFISGMIHSKRTNILIQEYTVSQNKSHVSLKSAKCKNTLFGILVQDDEKHFIRCTRFNFTREEVDRLKQLITMRTSGSSLS